MTEMDARYMLRDEDCYGKYHEFIQRIIKTTKQPEEISSKLQRIATPTLVNFSEVASSFDDDTLHLCFEALVNYIRGIGQMTNKIEGHNEGREARFLDAVVAVAPLMTSTLGRSVLPYNQPKRLAMIASPVAESKIGVSDMDVVRGYYLQSALDYNEAPDWFVNKYRWLGQHFDIIAENWSLFQERRILDPSFIEQLAKYDGSKPLSGGVL